MTKCPIHPQEELVERWKKDDPNHVNPSFFSHKHEDVWCNGKPPKAGVQSHTLDILKKLDSIELRLDGMASFLKKMQVDVQEVKPSNTKVPF